MTSKLFYILPVLAFLVSCKGQPKKENTTIKAKPEEENIITLSPEQYRNAALQVGQPVQQRLSAILRVNGVVDVPPANTHTISFPMGGYVRSINLLPGMQLRKGQVMATLEDQGFVQLQQDYLTAKSKLNFDRADFERQNLLSQTESNSQRILQQATTTYESQKVLVKALGEKLRLIGINPDKLSEGSLSRTVAIYAPVSGYVSKVNVNQGKYVAPTDVLFELIDPSELHINLRVFENDAQSLKPGQVVTCALNNKPDQKFRTRVAYVARNLDEDRAVAVHCHLEKPVAGLLAGNFVSGEIELDDQRVNAIPDGGIVSWQGKQYVFTTNDRKSFTLVPVATGASAAGFTAIQTAVPGSEIVTHNAYVLLTMLKNKSED